MNTFNMSRGWVLLGCILAGSPSAQGQLPPNPYEILGNVYVLRKDPTKPIVDSRFLSGRFGGVDSAQVAGSDAYSTFSGYAAVASTQGNPPTLAALADATGSLTSNVTTDWFEAYATGRATYYTRVQPLTELGRTAFFIPLRITVSTVVEGDATAEAGVEYVDQASPFIFLKTTSQTIGPKGPVQKSVDINLIVGADLRALMVVRAYAVDTFKPQARPLHSYAFADPLFEFDQATFDAQRGPDTFSLAENFEIVYSSGVVPEPGAGALMAVGAVLLARRRVGPCG
jgi:hypothetical protein